MHALLPTVALLPTLVDDVDVHDFYAQDWIDGGLRVDFIASADGAASAAGRSAGLQTPGDNRVFAALRDLADVVLAGAGTITAEGYRPIVVSEPRRAIRRDYGLPEVLPTAVMSRSLRLDPEAALFTATDRDARTIVLTCESAPADVRARLERVADVAVCGDDTVDPVVMRRALEERGLTRILSEGGPTVFTELVRAGVVDELCLTVSPLLVGPGAGRIAAGAAWPDVTGLTLSGVLEEDGALFLRYRILRSRVR